MVIWFGIGETSKILLIYLAIFAPVAMSALAGVKSAQQVRVRAAQSLGPAVRRCCGLLFCRGHYRRSSPGYALGLAWVGRRWWQLN